MTVDPARTAAVLTISDRVSAGTATDQTGSHIVECLQQWGFDNVEHAVVADGDPVAQQLRRWVDYQVDLVITTGGTGLGPRDLTAEQTQQVVDRIVPGISEYLRISALPTVPTAALSRGIAGVARTTLIVNLPGSLNAVRDGMALLEAVVPHALDQISGGDHERKNTH